MKKTPLTFKRKFPVKKLVNTRLVHSDGFVSVDVDRAFHTLMFFPFKLGLIVNQREGNC